MSQQERIARAARHYVIVIVVFAITGSIAVVLSRVLLSGVIGLDGNIWSGPWSYRAAYVALIPPAYSVTLVAVGTVFGKREYFAKRVWRMWGWLPLLLRWTGAVPRPDPAERRRDR